MDYAQIPMDWLKVNISDVCNKVTDGSHNPPKASTEGLPMLSAKNINHGRIDFGASHRLIDEESFEREDSRTKICVNDILLTVVGTLGRVGIVTEKMPRFTLQRSVAVLSAIHLEPIFFRYVIESPMVQQQILENAKGTAQKGIYLKKLRELELFLPPLAEQKQIATQLDQLLSQVNTLKNRLDNIPNILKRFRQSVLAAAVSGKLTEEWREKNGAALDGWENRKVGDFVRKIEAGKNLKCIEVPPRDEEFGIVKISAVTWGVYNEEASKTLPDNKLFIESRRIQVGDFLISRANTIELLGNPVIVHNVTKNLMLSDKVLRLVMSDEDKPWVSIFLRSYKGRSEIESRSTGNQMSMRNIGQKALLDIDMPKALPNEQAEIVKQVEKFFTFTDQIENQVNAAQTRINNLTQSILAKAFRGELTTDWREQNQDLICGENSAKELLERIRLEREDLLSNKKKKSIKKSSKSKV